MPSHRPQQRLQVLFAHGDGGGRLPFVLRERKRRRLLRLFVGHGDLRNSFAVQRRRIQPHASSRTKPRPTNANRRKTPRTLIGNEPCGTCQLHQTAPTPPPPPQSPSKP